MKWGFVTALTAGLLMVPVAQVSAEVDHEEFSVDTRVTAVVPGEEHHATPNDKWVFFEDKHVATEGVGMVGAAEYLASLDATLRGRLSPDGTMGAEWGVFTLSLVNAAGDLECQGEFFVQRYVDERYPATSPVPYGEAGKFRANCDDGAKVMGDMVGEFGVLDDVAGFLVTLHGEAR